MGGIVSDIDDAVTNLDLDALLTGALEQYLLDPELALQPGTTTFVRSLDLSGLPP